MARVADISTAVQSAGSDSSGSKDGTALPSRPSSVAAVFKAHASLQVAAVLSCCFIATAIAFAIASPDFGCAQSFQPQHHLLQAWISGGAFGALLLHTVNAMTSRRMFHDACTWYCLLILLNAAVRFLVACIGREHLVCVIPLGGMGSGPARGYSILTFLFWTTTAPTTLALLAALSGSFRQATPAFAWTVLCLATGSGGTFVEHAAPWIVLQLISVASECVVLYYMISFARRGLARAPDGVTRRLWHAILPTGVAAWLIIPGVWLLGQLNAISLETEVHLLSVVDYLVKLAYVVLNIGE